MPTSRVLVCFTCLISVIGCAQDADEFDLADRATVRLSPSAFPDLPEAVARELSSRGCRIPQVSWANKLPHNVIRGEFAKPGQTDWAVLCSRGRESAILVFWNGSPDNSAEIARSPDRQWLQGYMPTEIGFSRGIGVAKVDAIRRRDRAYGRQTPPLDHDAIDDPFIEKASVIHYYNRGQWKRLPGAD